MLLFARNKLDRERGLFLALVEVREWIREVVLYFF